MGEDLLERTNELRLLPARRLLQQEAASETYKQLNSCGSPWMVNGNQKKNLSDLPEPQIAEDPEARGTQSA
jgi:hypothetical protein